MQESVLLSDKDNYHSHFLQLETNFYVE